ncbi:MAG: hypothetical protein MJZ00_04625, partial [Paludibacteraceae bacterium]|nr:hypothetical protein [Paludibacteraceae bacterium]
MQIAFRRLIQNTKIRENYGKISVLRKKGRKTHKKTSLKVCFERNLDYLCTAKEKQRSFTYAEIAQLVEHDLAKVGVAG